MIFATFPCTPIHIHTVLYKATTNNFIRRQLLSTKSNTKQLNHYDIVIAGGGMVGTTLACTLGRNSKLANKHILLLEAGVEKPWSVPERYSNRVVSVNPGTQKLLKDINAWEHIKTSRFATVKQLQVWDGISDASITFGDESASEDVSYIVENDLLLGAVTKEVKKDDNVTVFYGAKVKNYTLPEMSQNSVKINMDNGKIYTCDLLLGCDGVNSEVRKAMDANYINWNYDQMGVVATLKLSEKSDNNIAWQRFLPTGPVALLPLTDSLSSLVWSTTQDHAKDLLKLPEAEFVDALNEAIWKTYDRNSIVDQATQSFDTLLRMMNCSSDSARRLAPKISGIKEGSRAGFPLGFGHATSYIGKGVALVGDAAHRVHPLAGQGVNLGFGDVSCLNKVLGDAAYSGSRIDNLTYLKDYESERQRHNVPTMLAVEGLHRLYNSDFTPIVLLRSLGLQATHALNPLKKAIITQAAT